jgi:thiamine-phosphate pyrophosphorylase
MDQHSILRILDVNSNRLREALRVIEEYFRFIKSNEALSIELKKMRHSLVDLEQELGRKELLAARDTISDCFSKSNRPEEMVRETGESVVIASFRRAQEAARVIEEYIKLTHSSAWSESAKKIRFSLYKLEKEFTVSSDTGG